MEAKPFQPELPVPQACLCHSLEAGPFIEPGPIFPLENREEGSSPVAHSTLF